MIYFLLITILLMQICSWLCARGLAWLLEGYLNPRRRRWVVATVFLITNGLLVVSVLRVWRGIFRFTAGWMALLWYGVMTVTVAWLLYRLLRRHIPAARLQRGLRLFAPLMFAGLLGLSLYQAYVPVVRHYQITLNKPLAEPVRIGLASDTHLGILFGPRQIDQLADIMNREQVDIILLPGDLMDDDTEMYHSANMHAHLQQLRAPLGVYATLGNHDLFGHQQEITAALQDAGIRVLHDEAVHIDRRFWLVGRPDEMDRDRRPTAELLRQVNPAEPVFLLDHRPTDIPTHQTLPIDVQVSGHVHRGQIFPANLITYLIYPLAYGHEARGNGHFFVTSGYGFWGVPLRLGPQSEVMIIDVHGR